MKNKVLKRIMGVALSVAMMVSMTAVAFAGSVRCDKCGCPDMSFRYMVFDDCYFINPDCHANVYIEGYECLECGEITRKEVTEWEIHTYDLDEATGILTCEGCGDSY